ncbi:MAG: S-layer protein, partial [Methanomicrobiales archaeon HGW-Methanomicrobiales-5]
ASSVRAVLDTPFTGTKTSFIGSIDKNSDAPAIFYLQAVKDGTVPANLTISYNDDFGTHTVSETATIMTAPASAIPVVIVAILICIIAGVSFWYFRVRLGKKHE